MVSEKEIKKLISILYSAYVKKHGDGEQYINSFCLNDVKCFHDNLNQEPAVFRELLRECINRNLITYSESGWKSHYYLTQDGYALAKKNHSPFKHYCKNKPWTAIAALATVGSFVIATLVYIG
ncbi:hypothetical protein ACLINW_004587 [Vibrio parahaemolyticus]|uniref:hypothetical protein n=1 Tax=Vibrio parahaemolyticus TaxID=670 RepID=UPI001E595184|nr:hypothetical protein [Vibrio parahaemolyticus]EJG1726578.1 hypothetical protein [Vibrio parahaemolyticus]EJG1740264.1 hypothetical protein [Vibrio parahaemolyticus]EJG1754408.1 hypothetical protein [Vibrio parahaemolyticus]EJG1758945.1 hypothetical protein [Vibrio parahaemolyticus]UYW16393.1 hypothetical protein IF561_04055 [Vibrio parahaemolyticus]